MTDRLEEISARIASVRQLGVVIGAMRSIAAARALQARALTEGVEHYAGIVAQALGTALGLPPGAEAPRAGGAPGLLVLFCAEQGFSGGYTARMLDEAAASPRPVLLVGHRGLALAREHHVVPDWATPMATHAEGVVEVAARIAAALYERVRAERPQAIELLVPVWQGGQVKLTRRRLVPLEASALAVAAGPPPLTTLPTGALVVGLVEEHVHAGLCRAAINAFVAENEARAQALSAARSAIDRMMEDLTARERLLRQESITAEVIELARSTVAR